MTTRSSVRRKSRPTAAKKSPAKSLLGGARAAPAVAFAVPSPGPAPVLPKQTGFSRKLFSAAHGLLRAGDCGLGGGQIYQRRREPAAAGNGTVPRTARSSREARSDPNVARNAERRVQRTEARRGGRARRDRPTVDHDLLSGIGRRELTAGPSAPLPPPTPRPSARFRLRWQRRRSRGSPTASAPASRSPPATPSPSP